jgi:Holliday junction resolvasome RuvABC endonuclease subunit
MMVIGFDLGREVGVCFGEPKQAPTLMTLKLPMQLGALLSDFEGRVRGLFREHSPGLIAWETPFINFGRRGKGERLVVKRVFGQAGAIERLAYDFGAPTTDFEARSLRKRFCGTAKASEDDIIRACLTRGLNPKTNHEADAGLVWSAAIEDVKWGSLRK